MKQNINFVEIYQYEREEDETKKLQIINEINKMNKIQSESLKKYQVVNFEDQEKRKILDQESFSENPQATQNNLLQRSFQRREKKGTVKFSLIQLRKQDSYTIDLSSTRHAQDSARFLDQNNSRSDIQDNFQNIYGSQTDRNLCSINNLDSPTKLNIQNIQLQRNNNSQINQENIIFQYTSFTDKNDIMMKQMYCRSDLAQNQTFYNQFEDNTSIMKGNNNYPGLQSNQKQNTEKDQQSQNEHLKEDQLNEIATVNSSKYSSDELSKRQIIKKITKNKINRGQKLMIYLGVISFLILILMTSLMQKTNNSSLERYQKSFFQIDQAQYLYSDIVQTLGLSNYQSILYSQKYSFGSNKEIQSESKIVEFEYEKVREDYKKNLLNLIFIENQDEIHQKLFEEKFNVTKYTVDFPEGMSHQVVVQNLEYTVTEYFYAIIQYIIQFTSTEENFIWDNLNILREKMKDLQKVVEYVIQNQFDNMEITQISILFIFAFTNFTLCIVVILLSVFIEKSKENILKLAGSFPPKSLENQVQIIELNLLKLEAIQSSKDNDLNTSKMNLGSLKKQQKKISTRNIIEQIEELKEIQEQTNRSQRNINELKFIARLPNKRNRSIASFNSISKVNWLIILYFVITFFILLLQPLINIIISQPYLKEAKTMVNERIALIDINGQMIENLSAHYSNMFMFSLIGYYPNLSYYYLHLKNITQFNEEKVQKLSYFQNSIDIKRHNQFRFDEIYRNIMNGDICQVRQAYPNLFNSNITYESCNTLFNGILQRGLILSFKTIFETFQTLVKIYESPDEIFDDAFLSFLEKYSLIQINTFCKMIIETVKALRLFQNTQSQELYEHIQAQFNILFYYQMAVILLTFGVGFIYLLKYLDKQFCKVKNIFSLFHINLLFENQFFLKYIQQKSTGIFKK